MRRVRTFENDEKGIPQQEIQSVSNQNFRSDI